MRQCVNCGKKGLFLKIEADTGLCLSCNEDFAREGKRLTEQIVEAKRKASTVKEPEAAAEHAGEVARCGRELISLHERYHIRPSQELRDLVETYQNRAEATGR